MSEHMQSAQEGDKKVVFRRRRSCPFSGPDALTIDWKDVKVLSKFISERGKMMPSRLTNVTQRRQRELSVAIKRARFMALMPYVRIESEHRAPRREYRTETMGGN